MAVHRAIFQPLGEANHVPAPHRSWSMSGITVSTARNSVGIITPASVGCICSSSSWRFMKYQGALDGFSVTSGLAKSRRGASMIIDMMRRTTVIGRPAMISRTIRLGQVKTVTLPPDLIVLEINAGLAITVVLLIM